MSAKNKGKKMSKIKDCLEEDEPFPRLSPTSDVASTYKHLIDRLQVNKKNPDQDDMGLICRNLEGKRARKEALDTLRQRILDENVQRESKLDRQREKSVTPIVRRKLFNSEVIQQKLSELSADTMRKYRQREHTEINDFSTSKSLKSSYSIRPDKQGSAMRSGTKSERKREDTTRKDVLSHKNNDTRARSCTTSFLPSLKEKKAPKELDNNNTAQPQGEDVPQSKPQLVRRATSWQEQSSLLENRIKQFVAKPNPTPPPQSLKMRRSTVPSSRNLSKAERQLYFPKRKDPVEGMERKSYSIVNVHTCPNINVYQDRSWMYQDRVNLKCRYIREVPSPVPPIDYVFHEGSE